MTRRSPPLWALLLGAALWSSSAAAQSWRTITAARQHQAVDTLRAHVAFGGGRITLAAAPGAMLYDVRLRFDADRYRPELRYDTTGHTLRVGVDTGAAHVFALDPRRGVASGNGGDDRGSDLAVQLARDVPLDLHLRLGACEGRLDFASLAVAALRVETAASDLQLSFPTPNRAAMSTFELSGVATGLTLRQLGNARARRIVISGGVGGIDLDFAGAWSDTTRLDMSGALGDVTIRVPRDAGVEAHVARRLADFDAPSDFTRSDGVTRSANWPSATRRLIIHGTLTLAHLTIVWE